MIYIAFLRGINVGTNNRVSMQDVQRVFEDLGFSEVITVLNSGNVIFDAVEVTDLKVKIERKLVQVFAFPISVTLRSFPQLQEMIKSRPFKDVEVTPDIRLYVTFQEDTEIFSAINLNSGQGTTDLMKELEHKYGKVLTTRNWNTVLKLYSLI